MSEQRPKGVIGEWYTLTTDFDGGRQTEDRKAGFTWQCKDVDLMNEPMIDGVVIESWEAYRLATPEEIARAKGERELTPYQQAVADHMATAPQELREYVCGRLPDNSWWKHNRNPVVKCGFDWGESKEGESFWDYVHAKEWQDAISTDFWQSRKQQEPQPSKPSKEAREFWERYFLKLKVDENNCTTDDLAELADEAMAEWQKRFE